VLLVFSRVLGKRNKSGLWESERKRPTRARPTAKLPWAGGEAKGCGGAPLSAAGRPSQIALLR